MACPDLVGAVHAAARENNVEELAVLVYSNPVEEWNVAAGASRRTPLHTAAASGALECTRLLLSFPEVDTTARDAYGASPLRASVADGDLRVITVLADLAVQHSPELISHHLSFNPCTSHACAFVQRLLRQSKSWEANRFLIVLRSLRRQGRGHSRCAAALYQPLSWSRQLQAPPYWDAHAHLQFAHLAPHLASILERARELGVQRVCVNSVREEDWESVASVCTGAHRGMLVPQFGVHPWYATAVAPGWRDRLRAMLLRWPRSGVGEAGLHFAKMPSGSDENSSRRPSAATKAQQEEVLRAQLVLALELGRAVSVHCVGKGAGQRLLALVREVGAFTAPAALVLHAYALGTHMVESLLRVGGNVYFSFCGTVTQPRFKRVREAARVVPRDRLLVESDAPDQFPKNVLPSWVEDAGTSCRLKEGHMQRCGQRINEPANIVVFVRALAMLRQANAATLAVATFRNARRAFGSAGRL